MTFKRFLILSLHAIILTACTSLDEFFIPYTPIPATGTPLPTSTTVWFPPSATATFQALATKLPTPEMRPGLGRTLLTDDFSKSTVWDTATSNEASATLENNHLTLAVQSQVGIASLRQGLLVENFYAEITAQPSVCKGEDSYGLLVRAEGGSYYRFALACNGTVRAERVSNSVRLTLQAPLPSGDVPPGAPGTVTIGVWAVGRELRLFLNGRYQLSINEPSFAMGTVGVFARSAGETPVVVTFSNLKVYEVIYTLPAPTP